MHESRKRQSVEDKLPINRKNPAEPGSGRAVSFCPCHPHPHAGEGERTEQTNTNKHNNIRPGMVARRKVGGKKDTQADAQS